MVRSPFLIVLISDPSLPTLPLTIIALMNTHCVFRLPKTPPQIPRPARPRRRRHRPILSPLRRPRLRLYPSPMPGLRPRTPPRFHLQGPTLLPLLPPTPHPHHWRVDRQRSLPRSPPPLVRLHHPQGAARYLPQTPPPTHKSSHPFSLQIITWNATSKTVIYRSKRHHTTKRNFETFTAPDFIAAALLHLPPKGQQGMDPG
jgi:hypothetical protein